MALQKKTVLKDLHWILTSTASNPKFYRSRCIGFKAEKEVEELLRERKFQVMDGGQFVFAKKEETNPDKNVILYYTVSGDDKKKYAGLYKKLAKLRGMKSLFFIYFDSTNSAGTEKIWVKRPKRMRKKKRGIGKVTVEDRAEIDVLKPSMEVFEFSRGKWKSSGFQEIKNHLKSTSTTRKPSVSGHKTSKHLKYMQPWPIGDIWKIYCNRYVLNVEFNGFQTNMMDLDAIIKVKNNYITIEQKEKDPIGKWVKLKGTPEQVIKVDVFKKMLKVSAIGDNKKRKKYICDLVNNVSGPLNVKMIKNEIPLVSSLKKKGAKTTDVGGFAVDKNFKIIGIKNVYSPGILSRGFNPERKTIIKAILENSKKCGQGIAKTLIGI